LENFLMMKPAIAFLATTALAAPSVAAAAPQIDIAASGPVVELSVFESVQVAPDLATIGAGVTSDAPTASEALRQNSAEMQKVIARIKTLGIAEKDIQTTGINRHTLDEIGDVNPYKYGRQTPGTRIPITSESSVVDAKPDYLLVLPWHFREGITRNMGDYLAQGGKLIYPLPDIEVVGE
jgi:hypothetical protein